MAANYLGMLGLGAGDEFDRAERAERDRLAEAYARMDPRQRAVFDRSRADQTIGRAGGDLVRQGVGALTGADTRNTAERGAAVRAELQRSLQGIDPTDIDRFYPVLIQTLQKHGMIAEATAAAREYEELKGKAETRATNREEIERRKTNDAARIQLARDALASKDPEKLIKAYASEVEALENGEYADPAAKAAAQARVKAYEAKLGFKPVKVGNEWRVTLQQGNRGEPARIVRYNTATGQTEVKELEGKTPEEIAAETGAGRGTSSRPAKDLSKWGTGVFNVAKFGDLLQGFSPRFAGGAFAKLADATGYSDFSQKLQALSGSDPAAAKWWSEYASLIVRIRHEIFGATLTAGEQAAFDAVRALRGLPPGTIVQRVSSMAQDTLREMEEQVEANRSAGQNVGDLPAKIAALRQRLGMPAGAAPAPAPAPAATGGWSIKKL